MIVDRVKLLLSTQRALSWNVFPSLRAVCVESSENSFYVGFYCDGAITDDEIEHCEDSLDDIFSDFSYLIENEVGMVFETPIIRIDSPNPISLKGDWVYYRHEIPSLKFKPFDLIGLQRSSLTNRVKLFLSTIYGLLGNVFPALRAICGESSEQHIYLCFYYDGEISHEDQKLCENAIDSIKACWENLSENEIMVEFDIFVIRVDYPKQMTLRGDWVYRRYEKSPEVVT